jgi:hypothetical protein
LRLPRDTLYPQKLALTSLTSGGCSVGIVRSRTKPTEFVLFVYATSNYSKGRMCAEIYILRFVEFEFKIRAVENEAESKDKIVPVPNQLNTIPLTRMGGVEV